jgi:signal transduction histidine kinase
MQPLDRLRLRLTASYAAVLLSTVALLGVGVFFAVRREMEHELTRSLEGATQALIEATHVRDVEQAEAHGVVADAIDELHIPDRALYLFRDDGVPLKPDTAPAWIVAAAKVAGAKGQADRTLETPEHRAIRLHAQRFAGAGDRRYVALVVATRPELEDRYASLLHTFAAAALAALVLVAGGGYVLVRQATAPIARSIDDMRRFMADAAHELRTPITVLRTRADLAAHAAREPASDTATLAAIEGEAARLGDIVEELLTLARADAGERPVVREPIYLDDVSVTAVDAIQPLAVQKGVQVDVGTFEEAPIAGDPVLVRRLLLIVLDNAVKFTRRDGQVRVDVASRSGESVVTVTDAGIGIPADQLPHVFERFYRGEEARRMGQGAGLGLAIARWIAELHGGVIAIASDAGLGTTVTIRFPARVPERAGSPGRAGPRGASGPQTA